MVSASRQRSGVASHKALDTDLVNNHDGGEFGNRINRDRGGK